MATSSTPAPCRPMDTALLPPPPPGHPPATQLVCRQCPDGRVFLRRCDLNRHQRTHARPSKCPFAACAYSTIGFSTAQDRRRHIAERHAANPPAFPCPLCARVCKRASNCRSHMQRTHGVPYARGAAAAAAATPAPATPRPVPVLCAETIAAAAAITGHGGLLTPAPDLFLDLDLDLDLLAADDDVFSERLGYFGQLGDRDTLPDSLNADGAGSQPAPAARPLSPLASPLASPRLSPAHGSPVVEAVAGENPVRTAANSRNSSGRGTKRARESSSSSSSSSDGGDDDDGDDEETPGADDNSGGGPGGRRPRGPPRQRLRTGAPADADEETMPCPFHLTDPAYFSRGSQERFSPCHTRHRYISTLLRHLGRAAHRLRITDAYASSFGVVEAGRPQPQAGLCRRCWTPFHDQAAFAAHVRAAASTGARPACARVSRSKREKFRAVLQTFCAPAAARQGGRDGGPADAAEEDKDDDDDDDDNDEDEDEDDEEDEEDEDEDDEDGKDEETDAKTDQGHSPTTSEAPPPPPPPVPAPAPGPPTPGWLLPPRTVGTRPAAAAANDDDYVRHSDLLAVHRRLDQLEACLRAAQHAAAGPGADAQADARPVPAAPAAASPLAFLDDGALAPFGFADLVDTSRLGP